MTKDKEEVMKGLQMATLIKVSIKRAKQTVKAYSIGTMEKCTMENGSMGLRKAMVSGKGHKEIPTLANGKIPRRKDTVFIAGKMEIDTKENGEHA